MAKWIEWIPEMAYGVHQQLLITATKHSGVIWLVEPPPYIRVGCSDISMDSIRHYLAEGGVPVGWIDTNGNAHSFTLKPPFEPPNFKMMSEEGDELDYSFGGFSKDFLNEMYDSICMQNHQLRSSMGSA